MSSLPTRGAWIEICAYHSLKMHAMSLPTRGAWIEMSQDEKSFVSLCRSPRGERGLKFHLVSFRNLLSGRSPRGERGLK